MRFLAGVTVALVAGTMSTLVASRGARAQTDAPPQDSSTMATVPLAKVNGFEIAGDGTMRNGSPGHWYRYVHDKVDTVYVFVAPFPAGLGLGKSDDTATYVFNDIDQYRRAFFAGLITAAHAGASDQVSAPRSDPVHIHGTATHGYFVETNFVTQNNRMPRYLFYGEYALPQQIVRVRADLPAYRRSTSTLVGFTHGILDGLVLASH
jgi:hypothetical protein